MQTRLVKQWLSSLSELSHRLASLSPWLTVRNFSSALIVVGSAILFWFSLPLPLVPQLVSWAVIVLALAFAFRPVWQWLSSPVLFFELVRLARRSNFATMRAVYSCAILTALLTLCLKWVGLGGGSFWQELWVRGRIPMREAAGFGEAFFLVFSIIQFVAVLIVTPVCAAPAIAEEKERRTLEFLLATRLESSEIMISKMIARLSYLGLLVLTGLPMLSLLQFLGGVEPRLLLAVFIVTASTLFSLTCLSLACSILASTSRGAIIMTYAWLMFFLVFSLCGEPIPYAWVTAGNPIGAFARLFGVIPRLGGNEYLILAAIYAALHLTAGAMLYFWAARNLRLRSIAGDWGVVPDTIEAPKVIYERRPRPHWEVAAILRPPLGDRPILWKELHAEPIFHLGGAGALVAILFTGMILPIGYVLLMGISIATSPGEVLSRATHPLAAYGGSFIACLLLLSVALRAGGTISRERMQRTWDNLLTTTLDNRTILFEKLLGAVLSVRDGWWVLGCFWGLGLVTGGLHPLAFLLLVLTWFVLAFLTAIVGLYVSLVARTQLQASLGGLLSAVGVFVSPWVLWTIATAWVSPTFIREKLGAAEDLLWFGLTPPSTLKSLAFPLGATDSDILWRHIGSALLGGACYALLAFGFWKLLLRRFGPVTGRMPFADPLRSKQQPVVVEPQLAAARVE
jgi:ABC-type transport system involved in multi-copper enzyme maturation permease subunit